MTTLEEIEKEKQLLACSEKSLALERLKKRKADTRRKIELGGLIIKSRLDSFGKTVVLGALIHANQLISKDKEQVEYFERLGQFSYQNPYAQNE